MQPRVYISIAFVVAIAFSLLQFAEAVEAATPSGNAVLAFYYLWYGTPELNDEWKHWNHAVLPHWTADVNKKHPNIGTRFSPPLELHSPFYPMLGPYSSSNRTVIRRHLEDAKRSEIDVLVLSWWGQCSNPFSFDTQGVCTDHVVPVVLEVADEVGGIGIAFHLEPYRERSVESIADDLKYLVKSYGHHSSIYRVNGLPMYYVYDSYHIPHRQWQRLLQPASEESSLANLSVRGSPYDGVFIGLWLERHHGQDLLEGGFDGIYSYFASDRTGYGANPLNWRHMCSFCRDHELLCDLSVGPGYQDDRIRPWNSASTRKRRSGAYYSDKWQHAIAANPDSVSITSFNEWGEGTQIEPTTAVDDVLILIASAGGAGGVDGQGENIMYHYQDYERLGSYGYMDLTLEHGMMFRVKGRSRFTDSKTKSSDFNTGINANINSNKDIKSEHSEL